MAHPPSGPRPPLGAATANRRASAPMGPPGIPRPSGTRESSSLDLPRRGDAAAVDGASSGPHCRQAAALVGPARGALTQDSAAAAVSALQRRCGALRTGSDVLRCGGGAHHQGGATELDDSPMTSGSGNQPRSPLASRELVPTTVQQLTGGLGRILPRKTASCSTLTSCSLLAAAPSYTTRPRLSWASSPRLPADGADGAGDGDGNEPTRNTASAMTFSRTSTAARRSAVFLLSSGGAEAKGGGEGLLLPSILAVAGTVSHLDG